MEFECDAWTQKDAPALGTFEMVPVVGTDGVSKLVRIPSGRAQEVLGKSVQDGSHGAKEGIKWQDKNVPPKIQIGLVLDLLETLLRYFLCLDSLMYDIKFFTLLCRDLILDVLDKRHRARV